MATKPLKELTEKQKRNAELKAGADKLRKEKAAAKKKTKKGDTQIVVPPEQTPAQLLGKDWHPSKAKMEDIVKERVRMAPGNVGVILDPETPLNEYPAILGHFQQLNSQVGFAIGDTINSAKAKYGAGCDAMLAMIGMTGKALSTLYACSRTAAAIPIERRQPELGFTVHRAVARIADPEKQLKLLTDATETVHAGKTVTVADMKKLADKAEPPKKSGSGRKPGAAKKSTAKKGKDAPKPEEYTPEELAIYDDVLEKLGTLDDLLGSKEGQAFLSKTCKVDNKLKRPLTARGKWITRFLTEVENKTGY